MAVDYTLNQGTLSRIHRANKASAKVKFGSQWVGAAEDFQQELQERQDYRNIAELAWEEGFASMGDRGAWASGELFDQFQNLENGFKEQYLEAVRQGDKMAAAKMLKEQQTRSNSLQSWKDTMETAKEINDEVGWSDTLSEDQKYILGQLASQQNAAVVLDPQTGEMVFDITMPDGSVERVARRDIDKLLETGVSPKKMRVDQVDRTKATEENAKSGKTWEEVENDYVMQNEERVTKENYERWMVDNIAGGRFLDHMQEHPEFKQKVTVTLEAGPDGVPGTPDDVDLSGADIQTILGMMRENYEIAKPYIVEWLTLKDKGVYESQQKRDKDAYDRERELAILGSTKGGRDAAGILDN